MLFDKQKTVIKHNYLKIINSIYPKISGDIDKIIIVLGLSEQRRGAPDAQKLYQETPESIQRREKVSAERKAFFSSTPKSVRPTKKQRRQIHQFLEK